MHSGMALLYCCLHEAACLTGSVFVGVARYRLGLGLRSRLGGVPVLAPIALISKTHVWPAWDNYYRKWNIVVHEWLFYYCYGDIVRIFPGENPQVIDKAPSGKMYLDGNIAVGENSQSIKERKNLSLNGYLEITLILNNSLHLFF